MNHGILFDIVHSSFVDGPGIRTTVFFKGCNLKCLWCHNPESQSRDKQMMFYQNKCIGCGACKKVCPNQQKSCDLCGNCVRECPTSAKKVCGMLRSVEEVMHEILKDEMFYQVSGGGVTFSGGECMLQLDFLKSLLIKCREAGIHTAVDTAGDVPWERFEEILPYTDVFLYDVKCITEELHMEGTKVSNRRILENLQKLSERFSGDIHIRIPVIPGFNTDMDEVQKIAAFVKKINCAKTELLPYHKLGENKYAAVGKQAKSFSVPSEDVMEKIKNIINKS